MTRFNKIIQTKRTSKKHTFEKMAKILKISPSFARHIVYSDTVPVSPRLIKGLSKMYRIPLRRLESLAVKRNEIGQNYYRKYRKALKRRAA